MKLSMWLSLVVGLVVFSIMVIAGASQTKGGTMLAHPVSNPSGATSTPAPTASCGPVAWTTQTPLPLAISYAAAASQGGLIYSFGGLNSSSYTAYAYRYDPSLHIWTTLASLPAPRVAASAVSDGSYLYILGGFDSIAATSSLYRYDPASNSYSTLSSFATPTYGQAAAYWNGKIYRIAGCTADNCMYHTNTVEVYTIATNTWAPAATYPLSAGYLSATALDGYIYAAGGYFSGISPTNKSYRYDPQTNSWSDLSIADLPTTRTQSASGVFQGRWILAGGIVPGDTHSTTVISWDAQTNTWPALPPMVHGRVSGGGAASDEAYYVLGGGAPGASSSIDNQRYGSPPCLSSATPTLSPTASPIATDTSTPSRTPTVQGLLTSTPTLPPTATSTPACNWGAWTTRTPYPTPIAVPAVAAQGRFVYSFGGAIGSTSFIAAAYKYDPDLNTWTAIAPLPQARAAAGAVSDGQYIYIVGGWDSAGSTTTLWRYDPAQNSYTTLTSSTVGAAAAGVAYLNGKIYRIAGCAGTNIGCTSTTNTVEVYTVASNTWAAGANYPRSAQYPSATGLGAYVYAAGGGNSEKTYRYDPATNAWDDAVIADLPGNLFDAASGLLNGRWILAGGGPNSGFAVAWDPGSNTWTLLPFPPLARDLAGGAGTGQVFVLVGGWDPSYQWTADTQQYSESPCPGSTPSTTPAMPTATVTRTRTPVPMSSATPHPPPPTHTPALSATPHPLPATATPCTLGFRDVHPADYFYTPVQYLACRGVISGYADGTFRPYNPTTRSQMVKIVVLGFGRPLSTPGAGDYTFHDVPPAFPFFQVIETAAAEGIVSGYSCGGVGEPCDDQHRPYFRPYANVTRGQLSKITVIAAQWSLINPAAGTFADVGPGSAFYSVVETAACHGIISGYTCGGPGEPCDDHGRPYFRQNTDATRGQIAKIVYLAITSAAGGCLTK